MWCLPTHQTEDEDEGTMKLNIRQNELLTEIFQLVYINFVPQSKLILP